MTENNFSKGSEWRKWDLHVHSNASDGTASPSEIIEEAVNKGISVIALTDHHTVKNIDETKRIGSEKGVTVISGIEFRTEYGSNSVHMIGFFPDIYENLKLDTKALTECILCPLNLSETEIICKGMEADPSITDNELAFKKGMFLVQVDFKKASELIHQYGGLVSVHAGNKSNSVEQMKHSGNSPKNVNLYDSLGPVKEELMREHIDICEISKENNKDFYFEKFGLPSIIASDAHDKDKVGEKYVWIKADKTFEGLKQIKYEPKSRVSISQPRDKKSYNIIEKIKFVDNSGNKKFSNLEIGLNPDLNAIIGGKSSGKSLLMHLIATTIGNQTDKKDYINVLKDVNLEVYYADDPNEKRTSEDRRIIEFLPQLYIEQIVRNKSNFGQDNKESGSFNDFIEELIRQDDDIQILYTIHHNNVMEAQNNINNSIESWIKLDRELVTMKDTLKPLGDKKAIVKEITRLESNIDELTQRAGLTESDLNLYNQLTEKIP